MLSMYVVMLVVGQVEKNAAEASSVIMVMGQTSTSLPSAPPIAEGATLEEVAPMEGSAPLGTDVGLSWALVRAGGDLDAWEGPALWWADR